MVCSCWWGLLVGMRQKPPPGTRDRSGGLSSEVVVDEVHQLDGLPVVVEPRGVD